MSEQEDVARNRAMRVANAQGSVATFITVGMLLILVGAGIAALAWPHTHITPGISLFDGSTSDPTVSHTGNQAGADAGLALAGIGQMVLLIGVVALGVRYGIESAIPNTTRD